MIYIYQNHNDNSFLINNIFYHHRKIIANYKENNNDILLNLDTKKPGVFVFHINRTFDESYLQNKQELVKSLKDLGFTTVNAELNDISKRYIQRSCQCININNVIPSKIGEDDEKLIVKSNLNFHGLPENQSKNKIEYQVLSRKNIEPQSWTDMNFVIEKFIENRNNVFYRAYKVFTKLVISKVVDDNLLKKMPIGINRTNYFINLEDSYSNHALHDMIYQIDKLSKHMFIDFGAFDIVVSDANMFYIIDINKTPHWGATRDDDLPIMRFLGSSLEYEHSNS